ncbi:hypothetical protein HPB47_007363 [Ixodes persulcatus]|uniref:Uncharacterized protein n=1 Tax=Ixodes persulcatus TaxID=34615 RepID=A0AC60P7U1_IXOPE|nr:hypothetical protein HPB47_007363 [Ixodes persulcatus]
MSDDRARAAGQSAADPVRLSCGGSDDEEKEAGGRGSTDDFPACLRRASPGDSSERPHFVRPYDGPPRTLREPSKPIQRRERIE